jgi:probable F420-dependent oxidoreductase
VLIGANLILNDLTLSILEVAPRVEAHGLESIFLGEHTHTPVLSEFPVMPDGSLPEFYKRFPDPFVQLAAAAAVTTRIRIGTGVALVVDRDPLSLAKSVASLDQVSAGRMEFGVGYGWNPLEMINHGVDPARRRAVFREKLDAIRLLLTQETTSFDGEFVHFTESWSYPKPVQRPCPPILIGAAGTRATFEDVIERADGWYPLVDDRLLSDFEKLAARAAEAGRPTPPVTAVEMGGQRIGDPWYFEDPATRRWLGDTARIYAEHGIHRLTVGIPADSVERVERALEALAALRDEIA